MRNSLGGSFLNKVFEPFDFEEDEDEDFGVWWFVSSESEEIFQALSEPSQLSTGIGVKHVGGRIPYLVG